MTTHTTTHQPVTGPFFQTDSRGRRYPTYVCESGHWHRSRQQATRCNQKHRPDEGWGMPQRNVGDGR